MSPTRKTRQVRLALNGTPLEFCTIAHYRLAIGSTVLDERSVTTLIAQGQRRFFVHSDDGRIGQVLRMSNGEWFFVSMAHRAPKGGITIGGTHYAGGKFIPNETLAKATPEEKAKLHAVGSDNPKMNAAPESTTTPNAVTHDVPKHLAKFMPKNMDTSSAGSEITIKRGGVAFDRGNNRASSPKVSFNTETKVRILGTTKRGTGEYEKTDYVAVLPGHLAGGKDKLLQIPSDYARAASPTKGSTTSQSTTPSAAAKPPAPNSATSTSSSAAKHISTIKAFKENVLNSMIGGDDSYDYDAAEDALRPIIEAIGPKHPAADHLEKVISLVEDGQASKARHYLNAASQALQSTSVSKPKT